MLYLLPLLCNRSCQNFVVHNNDHLFLLLSLQIGQAVLGVAEFCHVPVISCRQLNTSPASIKLHVVSHPLAGQPRLVWHTALQERAKRHDSLMPGLAPGTSLHCFLWPKQVTGPFKGGGKTNTGNCEKLGPFLLQCPFFRCSCLPRGSREKWMIFFFLNKTDLFNEV